MHLFRRFITVSAIVLIATFGLYILQTSSEGSISTRNWFNFGGMGGNEHKHKWWKEVVIYEIYIPSFKDSNDDGIGDILGIVSQLDYLRDLGIDVIAIGPHYQSPQVDMGYDISNYESVHEPYGTVEDVETLIEATHVRGMRIIFDLVINHSSSLHKWFLESRSSNDNPKRDWYFWRPAKMGEDGKRHPPNNWRSHFSGPTWTWDEVTQEYYFHAYAPEMPDFNWENEDCRKAIYETAMKFWLDRGIDGFRIDTVNKYSKDITFPDAPIKDPGEETQPASKYYSNGPHIHQYLGEMKTIFESYDAMTVGELSHFDGPESEVLSFVSASKGQLNMVFNFGLAKLGQRTGGSFKVAQFKNETTCWQNFVKNSDAWTTIFLENHDQGRSISRFGADSSPEERVRSGKMLAIVMSTATGTLFLYQGEEIGMTNIPHSWLPEEFKDVRSVNYYNEAKERYKDDPKKMNTAIKKMWNRARDHARLPMQWDGGENAGFCAPRVQPWMRVHDDWEKNNAQSQLEDSQSLLKFWKKLLRLRRQYKDLFVYGHYEVVETGDEDLFVFTKESGKMKSLTVVNMSGKQKIWPGVSTILGKNTKLLIGNVQSLENGFLSEWEGRVYLRSS
jgi:oligo-1,6-glucosidase